MNNEMMAKGNVQDNTDIMINNDQIILYDSEDFMAKEQIVKEDAMAEELQNIDNTIYTIDIDDLVIDYQLRGTLGNLESMQGSLRRDNQQSPIIAYKNENGKLSIIDGCRRYAALKGMGRKTVQCVIRQGVNKKQAAHLAFILNNERNALSSIDIARHIKAMRDDFEYTFNDLEIMGYGSPASIYNKFKLNGLPDKVQHLIQEGKLSQAHGLSLTKLNSEDEQIRFAKRIIDDDLTSKRTDIQITKYLEKGKKKSLKSEVKQIPPGDIPGVYMKDSRDMSELPEKSVHLVVTSPPYNVDKEYEKGVSREEHCEMMQASIKEIARVLIPGGIIALNVGDVNAKRKNEKDPIQIELMGHQYQSWFRKHSIFLTDTITWFKESQAWRKRPDIALTPDTVHTDYRILPVTETIYIFRKKGKRDLPSEEIILRSRLNKEQYLSWIPGHWSIRAVQDSSGHPAVYPDELCNRLIRMLSYEGDTVLDPFLGSGTTVKVARELNREGIGYERELQYKQVIMDKLGVVNKRSGADLIQQMAKNIEAVKEVEVTAGDVGVEDSLVDEGLLHASVGSSGNDVEGMSLCE
jgi:modification methylase